MKKQKQIQKQIVIERIVSFSAYDLDGTVENAIKYLQERFQPNDKLDFNQFHEYDFNIYVYRDRLETDKEYARRMKVMEKDLAKQKKSEEAKELRELKEYERLKRKFEK